MKRLFLITVLLFGACCVFAQNCLLKGMVVDAVTDEPLVGTHVHIKGTNKILVTGSDGYFSISVPFNEVFCLHATFVGYSSAEVKACLREDTDIVIKLNPDNELSDVYVYGARRDFGVKSTQMSAVLVPIERIEDVPALFGEVDVMKVLQKLPGVQSSSDGTSGIYVRGGNYDQNLITLDGSTLYNAEHLKGFVSAINGDMVNNVLLYKGAFPARYGTRLSGIVDIGIKEGDFERIKGSLGVGMLSSKVQLEGPIWKGRTSFNIGARMSYFDAIVMPVLERVYDKPSTMQPYANMKYYDINAKLVHKFSVKDKLSAVLYWGEDINDSAPTESEQRYSDRGIGVHNLRSNATENQWGNLVSSIFYTHNSDDWRVNTNLSYSKYDYSLKISSVIDELTTVNDGSDVIGEYRERSRVVHNSDIGDLALASDFLWDKENHDVRLGGKVSLQRFGPIVDIFKDSYKKTVLDNGEILETTQKVDTLLGSNHQMSTFSLYGEDDFNLGKRWKMNFGLRYSIFSIKNKFYHSLEPRMSLRYLINDRIAVKASYSRMAQGLHLLTSNNLVMPSDIWVPVTENIPLMTLDQWAIGYNQNFAEGINFSVEGYYKTMDNVLEYEEGASYTRLKGDWQQQVVLGKGRSYGVEFLLEKNSGKSTGWIGYTWAKSLRKFDALNNMINGGDEFYAGNDRRHNVNIIFTHTFNKHWKLSGSWTFQTGRRGTLTTTSIYGGSLDEYDAAGNPLNSGVHGWGEGESSIGEKVVYLDKFLKYYTYKQRNGFVLPNIHRLDIGLTYSTFISVGDLDVSLDICNVYNRMNISNVYIGYHNNQTVLKGVCMLPFMPSVNVLLKF